MVLQYQNDQKTLYVNISDRKDMKIMAYDIIKGVTNGRVFFDGMSSLKKIMEALMD